MTRRPKGSGSICQLSSGSWRALVTIDRKRVSHTAKTKKEAAAWLKNIIGQVEQGLTIAGAKTKFDQVLDSWLEVKRNKLRASTLEQYEQLSRLYIKPHLGNLTAKDLSAARLQVLYHDLQAEGVGARTIELTHTILHGCLKYAHRLGLVAQNWAALAEAPRSVKQEMSIWSENQVNQFLANLTDHPDRIFYRMAFSTGMRRGELIGLQWADLDWQSGVLVVRRQVYEPTGGGWRFQEPKTERGKRPIRLGPGMVEALRSQFNEILPKMRGFAGDRWQEHDLIFPSRVGTPRGGCNVSNQFKALIKTAGLPQIRFHDIRHTAASHLLLHGEPPIRVAAILGQSLAVLLQTYAHYLKTDDQASSSALMDSLTTPIPVDLGPKDTRAYARTGHKNANRID